MQQIYELEQEILNMKEFGMPSKKFYKPSPKIEKKSRKVLFDLDMNHNNSLAVELFLKNKNNLFKDAIYYRGNKVTYEDMFEKIYTYAKSLKALGISKGTEVPICTSNIPEFVYLFLACNLIGAKVNVVGEWFDKEYLKDILNKTDSPVMFVSDDVYGDIKETVEDSNKRKIIMFSITDSLSKDKTGKRYNPYFEIDSKFHDFNNKISHFKQSTTKEIVTTEEFEMYGSNYQGKVVEKSELDDTCAITYTSGTTDPGCPKGVEHTNRSYITLSRYKVSDVSGMPNMKNLTVLGHIPTYTHMELSCGISDTLYCGCTLALEPFYSKDFFPYSLLINKPNYVCASTGFWGNLCKKLNYDPKWKKIKMPYLMVPTVTGEGCSIGEEKFFNSTARKHKFGTDKLPYPLAPVTFSMGGGTTEGSGIFVLLYKSLQEKRLRSVIKKETLGLRPHGFAEVEVLDENGNYCDIGEPGRLVAISPCEMKRYTTGNAKSPYITDATGKTWLDMGTYSYKSDKNRKIKMKGRMSDIIYLESGEKIPYYKLVDDVSKDTKNILSCTVVRAKDTDEYICHFEMQPDSKKKKEETIESCARRIEKVVPEEVLNKMYIRYHSFDESFPIDPSGKRSITTLINTGVDDKCIALKDVLSKEKSSPKVYVKKEN